MAKKGDMKSFLKSKTLWINLALLVGGVSLSVADHIQTGGLLTLVAVINLVLRAVSKHKLVIFDSK